MSLIVLICLLLIIKSDAEIFKKINADLFTDVFKFSIMIPAAFITFLCMVLFFSPEKSRYAPALFTVIFLPLYLIRRERFLKRLAKDSIVFDPKTSLASDALGVILLWFYSVIVIMLVIKSAAGIFLSIESDLGGLIVSSVLSSGLILVFIHRAAQKFSQNNFWVNMGFDKSKKNFGTAIVIPVMAGLTFAYISASIILHRSVQPATPLREVMDATGSPLLIFLFLFLAIIVAPLLEEIIFRGYFYHVLSVLKGRGFAIFGVSLAFAFLHVGQYWGDWAAIGMVAVLGLGLTSLRAWAGTTFSSVVMHYVYNAGVTVIPIMMLMLSSPEEIKKLGYFQSLDEKTQKIFLEELEIRGHPP